jgi:transcriptional regulator with XRE-family HTH domain
MQSFARVVTAALQLLSEAVEREWTSREAWLEQSAVPEPLARKIVAWLDTFGNGALFEQRKQAAKQLRGELAELLGALEPQMATALLCRLPGAKRRGYSQKRLAAGLGVEGEQVRKWEEDAYARLGELVSDRTPLLKFLQERVLEESGFCSGETGSRAEAAKAGRAEAELAMLAPGEFERLLMQAGSEADFDVRTYVGAARELVIRQALHREGVEAVEQVEALFSDAERLAVRLIAARMKLEMAGKEVEALG